MKLLILSTDDILKYIDDLDKEVINIKKNALELSWAMRGGMQYNDVMNMSKAERELIASISKSNLEFTKKSGLPYF